MPSIKDTIVSRVTREIVILPKQDKYDITGVDTNTMILLYKLPLRQFEQLNRADYKIIIDGEKITLQITNIELLKKMELLQLSYEVKDKSSKYKPIGDIDINIFLAKYNELVDSYKDTREYIINTLMISDTISMTKVLPKLGNYETWAYDSVKNEFYAIKVADLQEEADEKKKQLDEHTSKKEKQLDNYVENTSKPEIKDYWKSNVNDYLKNTSKPDLDKHTVNKKTELNNYTGDKKKELEDKFNELQNDHGVIPPTTNSLHDLIVGRWWTNDITKFKDYPPDVQSTDIAGTLQISKSNNRKLLSYYATSGKVFFQVENQDGSWSDWNVSGAGEGKILNVGKLGGDEFRFSPVSWSTKLNKFIIAKKDEGADGISVMANTDKGLVYIDSRAKIPTGAVDDLGNPFIPGDYYFLSHLGDGKFQKEKPSTGMWQPLFQCASVENDLYAIVDISDPEDITPVVIKDTGEEAVVTHDYFTRENAKNFKKVEYKGFRSDGKHEHLPLETFPNLDSINTNSIYNFDVSALKSGKVWAGANGWYFVHTMLHSNAETYRTQIVYPMNQSLDNQRIMHYRTMDNNVWGNWKTIGTELLASSYDYHIVLDYNTMMGKIIVGGGGYSAQDLINSVTANLRSSGMDFDNTSTATRTRSVLTGYLPTLHRTIEFYLTGKSTYEIWAIYNDGNKRQWSGDTIIWSGEINFFFKYI